MRFSHPIYPITSTAHSGLNHKEQVERLAETGVSILQIREKTLVPREFFEEARTALRVARDAGIKVIINDRVDIAHVLGADGVHLGQDDLSPSHARRVLGVRAIIGYSTHTVEQAVAATELPIDYIAFGPVFHTSTKQNPDDVTGIVELRKVRSVVGDFPLVAIGGIDAENIELVSESGVDAAAVISVVFTDPDRIGNAVRNLTERWRNKIV